MSKYYVYAKVWCCAVLEVDAESVEEAVAIARTRDAEDFDMMHPQAEGLQIHSAEPAPAAEEHALAWLIPPDDTGTH